MSWKVLNGLLLMLIISEILAALNVPNAIANLIVRPILQYNNTKDFIQLATENGYDAEKHEVITEDGYILTMFRIAAESNCTKKVPLLLMHGLLQAAEGFIDIGPEAPGFLLAQECYDLWFGNVRGNYHSRRHTTLDPDRDSKFWKFSVDEIGKYDIPAMVDYVLDATAMKKLIYVGFSQGGGTFFIMNSEKPEYAEKIKLFIGLAPASRFYHTRSPVFRAISTVVNELETPLEAAGVWEILSEGFPIQGALSSLCQVKLLSAVVCGLVSSLVDSPHPDSLTPEIQAKLFEHAPAGTSIQNVAWYGQSMHNLKYTKFDYGLLKNLNVYGTSEPPEYNLGTVKMPTVIFHGQADHIVDTRDLDWAQNQLPNVLEYITVDDPLWNHLDLTYSRYWGETIFGPIVKYLNQYDEIEEDDI